MYLEYFGLQNEPFNIAPNPAMLFPSARHQEAIAYLKYGLRGTGGFVMLTGEVGTGKTMVSRAVLADVPEHFNIAYLLNPTLNSVQLLQSVCDAFGIKVKDNSEHKQLSDALQKFLVDQDQAGKPCLLVVDEAQHLSAEALEQLRLFTNIETNEKKLLQIILIGQPELQEKLNTRELRQLAQRITARYHLLPLTEEESFFYISHRLQAVGSARPLFSKKAISQIFKASHGTPRLINLISDRALMGTFAQGKQTVDKQTVQQAIKEVLPGHVFSREINTKQWWLAGAFAATVAVTAIVSITLF